MNKLLSALKAAGVLVLFFAALASDGGRTSLAATAALVLAGCALVMCAYAAEFLAKRVSRPTRHRRRAGHRERRRAA